MKLLAPRVRSGEPDVLAEIGTVPSERMLTVYVDLDPTDFATPPARATALRSLLGMIERVAGEDAASEAERVREYLTNEDLPTDGARALGLFVSSDAGIFEVVQLPRPVASAAMLDRGAALSPVASLLSVDRWLVLLVSRARARVFVGAPEKLDEEITIEDTVHRKHDQGGWSQARYQRSVEADVDRHLSHVASEVAGRAGRFDAVALGCTSELAPRVVDAFDEQTRRRYFGRFDVDVENTTAPEVAEAGSALFARRDAERLADALGRVADGLSTRTSVAGPADVDRVLEMRAVWVLLIEPGTENADLVIRRALAQRAEVLLAPAVELERYGRIAAVLRFPLATAPSPE